MKSILVTGGAGFIGSHLCERLLQRRDVKKVICVDNLDPAYDPKIKKNNLELLKKNKKFKFYKNDIRDQKSIEKIFRKEKPEYVLHLAAKTDTRSSVKEAREHETVNVHGTINILEASKDFGVKKVINFSSSSVYGNTNKLPVSEKDLANLPLAPYGATKIAGEVLSHTYSYNFNLPVITFRIFNAYGPRMRPGLVLHKWTESIMRRGEVEMSGSGSRKRDFTYVSDIVDAVIKALSKDFSYEIFNIGNAKPHSLTQLLGILERVTGRKAKVKTRPSNKASVDVTYADISKAKKILGWKPKVTMEKGISEFVTWFVEDRLKN